MPANNLKPLLQYLTPSPQFYADSENSFYVKDCGMVEKKEGKENEKCSTMPDVLIKGYKILRTVRVGQDFSIAEVEHKQSGIPDCLCSTSAIEKS